MAYMIKHPEKAEHFVRYAATQEYKVMIPAVELAGEKRRLFSALSKPDVSCCRWQRRR
jgi:hypothetical protein